MNRRRHMAVATVEEPIDEHPGTTEHETHGTSLRGQHIQGLASCCISQVPITRVGPEPAEVGLSLATGQSGPLGDIQCCREMSM